MPVGQPVRGEHCAELLHVAPGRPGPLVGDLEVVAGSRVGPEPQVRVGALRVRHDERSRGRVRLRRGDGGGGAAGRGGGGGVWGGGGGGGGGARGGGGGGPPLPPLAWGGGGGPAPPPPPP